jgi:hypothetical protein
MDFLYEELATSNSRRRRLQTTDMRNASSCQTIVHEQHLMDPEVEAWPYMKPQVMGYEGNRLIHPDRLASSTFSLPGHAWTFSEPLFEFQLLRIFHFGTALGDGSAGNAHRTIIGTSVIGTHFSGTEASRLQSLDCTDDLPFSVQLDTPHTLFIRIALTNRHFSYCSPLPRVFNRLVHLTSLQIPHLYTLTTLTSHPHRISPHPLSSLAADAFYTISPLFYLPLC